MQASKENIDKTGRLGPQAAYDILRKTKTSRWVAEGLVLQALPRHVRKTAPQEPYGVCISVSKKTAKRAHDRNRIKRRLKAVSCEILPVHAQDGLDYMITGRYGTADRDFELLKKDLLWCIRKLGLGKQA